MIFNILFDFNSIQKFNFSNRNGRYKVVSIERQCFKDFTNLEVINLNKNELTKIDAHSFQNLNKLKNQFFITTTDGVKDSHVKNEIGLALAERIKLAHE